MEAFNAWSLLDARSLLLGVVVFLVLFWFLRRPRNLPPGPWGWPILGNIPQLMMSGQEMHETFSKLSKRYGNVIRVQVAGISMVILHGHSTAKEAFAQHQLSARPALHVTDSVRPHGEGVHETFGDIRRFAMTVLRGLGVGKSSFEQNISTEAEILVGEIKGYKGKPFDPKHLLGNAVSNIICSVVFGKRFQYFDPEFQRLLKVLSDNAAQSGAGGLFELSPILAKLTMLPVVRRYADAVKNYYNHIEQLLEEHVHEKDTDNPRDLIDIFMNENEKKKRQGTPCLALQSQNLLRVVSDLFGAGSETVATTLRWGMLYLMAYPDVQTRVQKELDDATSRNRLPRISDKPELPYTEAVLSEIQRIGSVAPLGLSHLCSEDTTFMGYNIPKGTLVSPNFWHNNFDPSVWKEPKSFRPERFIHDDEKFHPREDLTPFGIGRRYCLGEHLAKMELFIFFTHLLHHFTLKNPDGAPPVSFKEINGVVRGPEDFAVCAIPRK